MSHPTPRPLLVPAALSLVATVTLAAPALAEPTTITFVHVNDLDRMEEADGRGGFARMMGAIAQERARSANVVFTHGGDAISPSLLSGFDQGAHIIDLMNAAGIDIFVPGNHEYDFGPEVARQRFAEATFPIVATNTAGGDGQLVEGTAATRMIEVAGYKIGFLGLTTPDTVELASPGDITFADPAETAARAAEELRAQGADLVVALSHTAIDEDFALIRGGDVDLILGGHDQFLMTYYDEEVAFAESASQANYVTAVDVTLDRVDAGEGQTRVTWTPAFRIIDTRTVEPDPDMAARVQSYLDKLSAELDVEIGTTTTELDSRRATIRGEEAAIGNLIADATRAAVDADIAITNSGGIRADRIYEPGTVLTRRDIQSELPFGNRTVKLQLTGAQIMAALENGFSQVEEVAGRFPQVSGLSVTYDPAQPPGQRVLEVQVDGAPLDMNRTYTVATNDYMASGGDGYAMFVGAPNMIDPAAAQLMASQVIDYIEQAGTVAPKVEGRIKTVD